jgi:prepilin-type N-terminal cleavage/methylation domain-containing protein
MRGYQKGFTLIELLIVVNIVAILVGVATVLFSEYGGESRCTEIYKIIPQLIRSQALHKIKHNKYFAADHENLKNHGVDVSEVRHFTYSTFPNEISGFSLRADATDWAAGGWVVYMHRGNPTWSCDDAMIRRNWLPE